MHCACLIAGIGTVAYYVSQFFRCSILSFFLGFLYFLLPQLSRCAWVMKEIKEQFSDTLQWPGWLLAKINTITMNGTAHSHGLAHARISRSVRKQSCYSKRNRHAHWATAAYRGLADLQITFPCSKRRLQLRSALCGMWKKGANYTVKENTAKLLRCNITYIHTL